MSKNPKNITGENFQITSEIREEYALIKSDLFKILLLNFIYLAGILALFYSNQKSQYLEKWFNEIFKF